MKYGLIGEHLPHSFSKEIHAKIADYSYELCELTPEEIDPFMRKRDFFAINVTIPYKERVIPYLDEINESAKKIGAVNTIVNKNGKLYGYNTDFLGLCDLIEKNGIEIKGKKVIILGTGGTSNTARAVASHLGATKLLVVGRAAKDGCISYEDAKQNHTDAQVIINTTPCGMYPYADGTQERASRAIDISIFPRLEAFIDAVYNPLRTDSVLDAKERGLKADGGLYMLVSQATAAYEFFTDSKISRERNIEIYKATVAEKENIVLVGMPGSGKSTVGATLAKSLGRALYDSDEEIVKKAKMPITEIFAKRGEQYFRDLEAEVIRELSAHSGVVISTGGGVILRKENIRCLRRNGRIYFLDRPLDDIIPTSDRPLALDREAVKKRYNERYGIYCSVCDCRITDFSSVEATAQKIREDFYK